MRVRDKLTKHALKRHDIYVQGGDISERVFLRYCIFVHISFEFDNTCTICDRIFRYFTGLLVIPKSYPEQIFNEFGKIFVGSLFWDTRYIHVYVCLSAHPTHIFSHCYN